MGSHVENNAVLNNNQEVEAALLQFLIDSQEAGFDSPSALQSQNLDEEDVIDFADSLPIAPDEYGVEIPPHLLNDFFLCFRAQVNHSKFVENTSKFNSSVCIFMTVSKLVWWAR